MTRPIAVVQADVFTTRPFGGNPALAVLDADGLDEAAMQRIAGELRAPGTAFVSASTRPDADWRLRMFTPRREVGYSGHTALGGTHALIEAGRVRTPDLFDLTWEKPAPLVPRRHRLEVDERIAADGQVVRPLDRAGLLAAAERLVTEGAEVLAVSVLNSYVNPAHEHQAERLLGERFPGLDVTLSAQVLPEIKEYERTSTTVVNAYLLPVMRRYLTGLADGLRGIGVEAPLLVVASNGGVVGAREAGERPVFAVGSGPAAGVAGAARLAAAADTPHLIAFDMGGTTAKASLVEDGRLSLTTEYEFREGLSTSSRFIKAGGYMLKVPAIDIAEVGAGAGSIAGIDDGGLLRVGPESAGADPGPACYGQGGRRPTVTDANVVLGFLNPSYLAGGELPLRADLAVDAIRTHVAEPLGLSVREAAHGIREIANASMARAIRSVTIERGRDPRDFTLVAFGGSGPVHAVDVARALDIRRVLVPVSPGVFTAVGMLASDVEHHFVRAAGGLLAGRPLGPVNARLDEMVADALATLAREGYSREQVRLQAQADLRYAGQSSELVLPLAAPRLAPEDLPALTEAFAREYARTYGFATGEALELVNVRLVATGVRPHRLDFRSLRVATGAAPGSTAPRKIAFDRRGPAVETPVLAREALPAAGMAGPLIVEGYDSTVVVPPGARIRRDAHDALSITLGPGSRGDAA